MTRYHVLYVHNGHAVTSVHSDPLEAVQQVSFIDMYEDMYLRGIYCHTGAYNGPEPLTRAELRKIANANRLGEWTD